ncbi:MAG: hypothetical protein BWX68_02368 [Verrucomicrobia bacterium ADurb.Bin063]|nr:MAG: hypothetical protein BWX68_02368 [Verrucomicrobia bacterium ADurb.Bin063]
MPGLKLALRLWARVLIVPVRRGFAGDGEGGGRRGVMEACQPRGGGYIGIHL